MAEKFDLVKQYLFEMEIPVISEDPPEGIVVVDDDTGIREMLEGVLRTQGHQVSSASDGDDGLDLIRRTHPDLIFLDLMMPRVDGKSFYDSIRRENPELAERIVFMSGGAFTPCTIAAISGRCRSSSSGVSASSSCGNTSHSSVSRRK